MRNDVILTAKNVLEDAKDLSFLSLYSSDNIIFGVYVNDIKRSISFLSLPENHIETTIDHINFQFFELGALLHHIYFDGALKFLDILNASDNIMTPPDIFIELCNFVVENLPFNIAKLKIIESIDKINDHEVDADELFYLKDIILNFYEKVVSFSNIDFDNFKDICENISEENDLVPLCNIFNDFKQQLNEVHFSKVSEKNLNIIDEMYVELQIRHMKV